MNILDENVPASQQALLRNGRLVLRQIGHDLGRNGMKDDEILPLLHGIDRRFSRSTAISLIVAFVTRDIVWSTSTSRK